MRSRFSKGRGADEPPGRGEDIDQPALALSSREPSQLRVSGGWRWLRVGANLFAPTAMKIKLRNSKTKKAKKTGFRTRQKTVGGRKVNKRQRARHGSI